MLILQELPDKASQIRSWTLSLRKGPRGRNYLWEITHFLLLLQLAYAYGMWDRHQRVRPAELQLQLARAYGMWAHAG